MVHVVYIGQRMLKMEVPGRRLRGKAKRRFMDVLVRVGATEAWDWVTWREMILCGGLTYPNEHKSNYDFILISIKPPNLRSLDTALNIRTLSFIGDFIINQLFTVCL